MKILLITTALLLSVSLLNAQEKKEVDTYKIAFFSKDASGVFKEMSGTVETSKPGVPTAFNLDIDVASINTGNGVQNKHAKSSEWFDAKKYDKISFKSSEIIKNEEGVFANGMLNLHGVSKEVSLPLEISLKDGKYFYKTKFSVKRAAYNLGPKSKVSPVIKIIAALTLKQ